MHVHTYLNIIFLQTCTPLSYKYVIHINQKQPLKAHTQLTTTEVRQRIQEQQFMEPEAKTSPKQDSLNTIIQTVVLQTSGKASKHNVCHMKTNLDFLYIFQQ